MAIKDIKKDVTYLNKDFVSFRNSLIDFAKVYFPNSYNDFNELSPGMMFIEMSSYVGDVLSYYTDSNLKESFLNYAEEKKNLIYSSKSRGYKYKTTFPATTKLDVYQTCPSTGTNGEDVDFRFALKIEAGMIVKSTNFNAVTFRTLDPIDFSNYDSDDFNVTIYEVDGTGQPTMYLLKKQIDVVAGTLGSTTFTFTTPEQFKKVIIPYDDVIEVLDIYDSDGNKWYEVDYLAQDTIFFDEENVDYATTTYGSDFQNSTRILKMKKVSKRYTLNKNIQGNTEIQFGAGTSAYPDQIIVPSEAQTKYNNNLINFTDVANSFLITRTYGQAPSNTTLTVRYTRGGGIESNVPQGDLAEIKSVTVKNSELEYESDEDKSSYRIAKSSLGVDNPEPATGGKGAETAEEIRQNTTYNFLAQNRCVTESDYMAKTLGMPEKYGSISKAHVKKDKDNFAIDIYVLGYDSSKKLTLLNNTIKENLIVYLSNYRDLTTAINLKDAFIINIAVNFNIVTYPKYNKDEVLLLCIDKIKTYFNVDKWQIGQPIILSDIYKEVENVDGVRTALNIEIENKYSLVDGYSNNYYHIKAATVDGVIYPSLDPSIFEIKYPNTDITGRAR